MQENKNDETIAMTLVKAYAEQTKKITFILVISIIINLLIVCAFLVFISQYDIENTEVQQDGYGINNYIGGSGDNNNGATGEENNISEEKRQEQRNVNTDGETKAEKCINLILAIMNGKN